MCCQLGSSQRTRVAGPCSEKSNHGSLPTMLSPHVLLPHLLLLLHSPYFPKRVGTKGAQGNPCFIPTLYTLSIFCIFPSDLFLSFFFLLTCFFVWLVFCLVRFFCLLKLPKATQEPPCALHPPEHLAPSSPPVHPSPARF